ncbi:MAG: hypothetical protein LUC94_13980, partial [Clostridiales bacterium]|nr:hypothetical protein [Clostridiales bacterium]
MDGGRRNWRRLVAPFACLVGSMALYLAIQTMGARDSPVAAEGRIARSGYGGKAQEYELCVSGLEEDAETITVEVSPMAYSEEEAEAIFYEIMDQMEETIRGENSSLMEVTEDLNLPSLWKETGVRIRWNSSKPVYLDSSGQVAADLQEEETLVLQVRLSTGEGQAECELPVRRRPGPQSERVARLRG